MESSADFYGGFFILIGILLYLWRHKRVFDRTNSAGIEQFSSYSGKLVARFGDLVLWLFGVLGVTFGVILMAHTHESTWGWMVLLPFYWWLFIGVFLGKSK